MSQPDNVATRLTIVTGGSRGLGRALAEQRLARGDQVLTLQRTPDNRLRGPEGRLEQWSCDLSDPLPVADRLQAWLAGFACPGLQRVTLIHNAALLTPPGPLEDADNVGISQALRVGLEAPAVLSAAFLRATQRWPQARRELLFISSGLGRRALAGSAVYGATKAGMDHLCRAIALEQQGAVNPVRAVSLAPGIIDTDMQRQLRGADPARFPAQSQFQSFKDQGQLLSPEHVADRVLAVLDREDFGRQPVADVRDPA